MANSAYVYVNVRERRLLFFCVDAAVLCDLALIGCNTTLTFTHTHDTHLVQIQYMCVYTYTAFQSPKIDQCLLG